VLDGIAVLQRTPVGMFEHTTGSSLASGAMPDALVRLIESGRSLEALERCLVLAPASPWLTRLVGWRLSHNQWVDRALRYRRGKELRERIFAGRERIPVRDVVDFFCGKDTPLGVELGRYLLMRFGQPRHLAALALLSPMEFGEKPVLDLACGAGHIAHYLTGRSQSAAVVGLDINFFQLWIARHWVAPAAHFVCANVADGLPFSDDAFSAVLCSDAYHYIPQRRDLIREIGRCAPGRPVVMTRVGNRAVMPNEGMELDCRGYVSELGGERLQICCEEELVHDYLARRNPLAGSSVTPQVAERTKWFSFVVNGPEEGRGDMVGSEWPHAVGRLQWNPLYERLRGDPDNLDLQFRFPFIWYAYENGPMLRYHPRKVRLSLSEIDMLQTGASESLKEALVRQFVLLGMPERYTGTGDLGAPAFEDTPGEP